jgi:hypothetical protein
LTSEPEGLTNVIVAVNYVASNVILCGNVSEESSGKHIAPSRRKGYHLTQKRRAIRPWSWHTQY